MQVWMQTVRICLVTGTNKTKLNKNEHQTEQYNKWNKETFGWVEDFFFKSKHASKTQGHFANVLFTDVISWIQR